MTSTCRTRSPVNTATIAVRTLSAIPVDVVLGSYSGNVHFGKDLTDIRTNNFVTIVKYADGRIFTDGDQSERWMQHVQVARDRHEQNIEVTRSVEGQLFFRTLKNIEESSLLSIWYSDQLAREIGIPVLTPVNIKGDQSYICDRCQKSYQYPNSLKAHIRYRCDVSVQQSSMSPSLYPHIPSSSPCHLSPVDRSSPRSTRSSSPHDLTIPSVGARRLQLGVNSAFVPPMPRVIPQTSVLGQRLSPLSKTPSPSLADDMPHDQKFGPKDSAPIQIFNHIHTPALIPMDYSALRLYYPFYRSFPTGNRICCPAPQPFNGPYPYMYPFGQPPRLDANSRNQMTSPPNFGHIATKPDGNNSMAHFKFPMPSEKAGEPLDLIPRSLYVSKSRKGHLCIYCGKLYSRKYGLKIHLRTHTGYKPLKCKVCLRPFGDPSNLNKHIRLHAEGDTPYRCDYCGKVLVRRRDLERHVKSRHPNEAEKCELENTKVNSFSDESELSANDTKNDIDDEIDAEDEIIDVSNF